LFLEFVFVFQMTQDLKLQDERVTGLRVQGLSVRRGSDVLFKALSFQLEAGQLVWLRGSNGSGKTSLLRVIAGLSRAESGKVSWNNQPLTKSNEYRSNLVHMGHTNALKDDLTALESLEFLSAIHGRSWSLERAEKALNRMGVFHRRRLPVRVLSQGQKRRVALARLAMEENPGFWVLDEPFDALDNAGIETVQELFCENARRGGTVLFTSHIRVQPQGLPLRELTLQGMDKP
jgi:heme exporter protein A